MLFANRTGECWMTYILKSNNSIVIYYYSVIVKIVKIVDNFLL